MDKYILVMLMGTQDRETGEYPNIPLFAKAGDLAGIRSFERMDKMEIKETPEADYIPAGTMAVFDPDEKNFKPISLYARYTEWLDITIIASEHITGGEAEETQDEGN
jgi:hypothetical protein